MEELVGIARRIAAKKKLIGAQTGTIASRGNRPGRADFIGGTWLSVNGRVGLFHRAGGRGSIPATRGGC